MHIQGLAVVTAFSGMIGGVAGGLLQPPVHNETLAVSEDFSIAEKVRTFSQRHIYLLKSLFLGMTASFIVPLFLSLSQSTLISQILLEGNFREGNVTPKSSLLIYIGFCLVVAVYYQTFLSGISGKILENLNDIKKKQLDNKRELEDQIQEVGENVSTPEGSKLFPPVNLPSAVKIMGDATSENSSMEGYDFSSRVDDNILTKQNEEHDFTPSPHISRRVDLATRLTTKQLAVLKSVAGSSTPWRLASNIARETHMRTDSAIQLLDALVQLGYLVRRPSRKLQRDVYALTSAGAAALK